MTQIDGELHQMGDYAIYFPPSEEFSKSLHIFSANTKCWEIPPVVTRDGFLSSRSAFQTDPVEYYDSRFYTKTIIDFFSRRHFASCVQLDVGSYLGTFSIEQALLAKYKNLDVKIFAFEPGPLLAYLKENIEVNGLSAAISVVNAAVSDKVGETIYEYMPGWVIAGMLDGYSAENKGKVSYPCKTTTIDHFLKQTFGALPPDKSFIIKLDCQGLEPKVYQGCRKLLGSGVPVVFLSEFLCWSYKKFGNFYAKFLANHHVIDIRNVCYRPTQSMVYVKSADLDGYIHDLSGTTNPWTDFILIPKKMKFSEELVADLLGSRW